MSRPDSPAALVIRVIPRHFGAALVAPVEHYLVDYAWLGSSADCALAIPDLEPHQLVVRRLGPDLVVIQDQTGAGIRHQPPGQCGSTIGTTVTVWAGERVTLARYEVEVECG